MAKIKNKKSLVSEKKTSPILWNNKSNNVISPEKQETTTFNKDYNKGLEKVTTDMQELSESFLPQLNNYLGIKATQIPFLTNLIGYYINNPSTVSIDTFRRIAICDPTLTASINYHSDVVTSMIGGATHSNPEIQQFLNKVYSEMDEPLQYYFKDMYGSAYISGFSLQAIYDTQENGYYQITHLLPLPSETVVFAVEADGRLHKEFGYNQYVLNTWGTGLQNQNYFLMDGLMTENVNQQFLPDPFALQGDYPYPLRTPMINLFGLINLNKEDVFHFYFSDPFSRGNPYRISKLRSLYSLIVLKYGVLQFLSQVLAQKSFPLLVIKYDGTMQTQSSEGGEYVSQPLQVSIDAAIEQMRELGIASFPTIDGVEIESIKTEGDIMIFVHILEVIESWLFLGNGTPPTLGNAFHGQVQHAGGSYLQDSIHNKIVASQRNDLIKKWCKTIQRKIIENNFIEGVDYQNGDWGSFEVLSTSIDDKMKLVKVYESMIATGLMSNTVDSDVATARQQMSQNHDKDIVNQIVSENKKQKNAELNHEPQRGTNFREAKDAAEQPYAHYSR